MDARKSLDYFSELIENRKIGEISLTIYYVDPGLLRLLPYDIDFLVKSAITDIIYVDDLGEHIDLFRQLNSDALVPVEDVSRIDAEIYYVFKNKYNRKIFDVAMWGSGYSIYINGLEVKSDDIFYDIIMPFVPDEIADYLEASKIASAT
jgi:hypothetical protein